MPLNRVSEGLTRTVVVNSIPVKPLKCWERDTDGKRVQREGEWEQLGENKHYEIKGLAVMRRRRCRHSSSSGSMLAVFI